MAEPSRGPDPRNAYDARRPGETFMDVVERLVTQRDARRDAATARPTSEDVDAALTTADGWSGPGWRTVRTLAAAVRALRAELQQTRTTLRELVADSWGPCSFWACPGDNHPRVDMATCNVCDARLELRALLGDPPPECTALECHTCGKESPWCEPCDEKVINCQHAPATEEARRG